MWCWHQIDWPNNGTEWRIWKLHTHTHTYTHIDFWQKGKGGFPSGGSSKEPACQCRTRALNHWIRENLLEKKMTTYFSILVWKNPMDRGTWRATVLGASKSWTQLSNWAHIHAKGNSVGKHSLLTYGTGTIGHPQWKKKDEF